MRFQCVELCLRHVQEQRAAGRFRRPAGRRQPRCAISSAAGASTASGARHVAAAQPAPGRRAALASTPSYLAPCSTGGGPRMSFISNSATCGARSPMQTRFTEVNMQPGLDQPCHERLRQHTRAVRARRYCAHRPMQPLRVPQLPGHRARSRRGGPAPSLRRRSAWQSYPRTRRPAAAGAARKVSRSAKTASGLRHNRDLTPF